MAHSPRRRAGPAESLTVLAAAVALVLWASAFVVIRSISHVFSPGALAFARLLVGTLVLSLFALRRRQPIPRGRHLALVGGYGLAWFAGYAVALNWAERHLDAGTASLLVQLAPVLVAVGAGLLLGEGFPRPLVIGLGIAISGVVVISFASRHDGANDALGVVLGVAAAVLYAVGMLLQKLVLPGVDALTATWLGCSVGALATVPFAGQAWAQLRSASAMDVGGVIFLGVGPTAIAFTAWAYALSSSAAGRMAATTLVVPVIATFLSWLVLAEVPPLLALAGGVLCLVGVVVTRRGGPKGVEEGAAVPSAVDHPQSSTHA